MMWMCLLDPPPKVEQQVFPWKATETQRERIVFQSHRFFRGKLAIKLRVSQGKMTLYYRTRFPEGAQPPQMPVLTGNKTLLTAYEPISGEGMALEDLGLWISMLGFVWPRCKRKKFQTYFLPNGGEKWWCTMVYKKNHSKSYGTTIFLIHSDSSFPSKKNIWNSLPIL